MTARILIVGGYGHVGRLVAEKLIATGRLKIRLAGRDAEKARMLAAKLGCEARRVDLHEPDTWEAALDGVTIVLVCIDQPDGKFAAHVLQRGCTYLDITASDGFFRKVEKLDGEARSSSSRALLSVGLAPGLTNLLVKACAEHLDHPVGARIGIMLGLGDAHGPAAVDWTLEQFRSDRLEGGVETMAFGRPSRLHPAMPVGFADQYVVRRTLGLEETKSVLTFDSPAMSRLAFMLLRIAANNRWLEKIVRKTMPYMPIGSDRVVLAVEVYGTRDGRPETWCALLEGRKEAGITALVAALAVFHLLDNKIEPGVHHIEEVLSIDAVMPELQKNGVQIYLPECTVPGHGLY
ncbi:NAD(P)H-binding protein [Sinorhizobium arboris]|uniref:NAD(P)H-binding protein n=1 Tax=Sinorhizobium arboris TaxID=76745 RepID=UPI0003FD9504|nr:NAD(P)H-binding protein [Sinorhizobium arboris]